MTIEYVLMLQDRLQPRELSRILREEYQLSGGEDASDQLSTRSWIGHDSVCVMSHIPKGSTYDFVEAEGIKPDLDITFQLNGEDRNKDYATMVKDIVLILSKVAGDAALYNINGPDQLMLLRKRGRLEINLDDPFWDHFRHLLTIPHTFRSFSGSKAPTDGR